MDKPWSRNRSELTEARAVAEGERPFRIVFVAANYPPSVGGAQLLIQRVAEGLVERYGHSVTVVTTDTERSPGGPDPGVLPVGDEVVGGVLVQRRPVARRAHRVVRRVRAAQGRLGVRWMLPATQLLAAGPMGLGLARTVRAAAAEADVVVGVGSSYLTIPLVDRSIRHSMARAVHLPLLHLSGPAPRPAVLSALRRAACVVALTEYERDWLIKSGVAEPGVVVIPPGCDPLAYPAMSASTARQELGIPDRPTIGYVGRLASHKGIDILLMAMERVWAARPDVNLLLAGTRTTWSQLDELLDRIRPLAGDRLVLRERFTDEEKALLYASSDVIAFPSREESFGMVTIEAWCARRPVVAGDIGAVRSLIREGVDGELVDVDDVEGWAVALEGLLGDAERSERLGLAGRARVEQEFAWPVVVDRWHEVLETIDHDRSPQRVVREPR